MDPTQPWANFNGGATESIFSPVALGLVLLAGILVLLLPRTKVIFPLLLAGLLIPSDQVVVFAGVHFPMVRILLLFGFVRVGWAKFSGQEEVFSGGLNSLDKVVILLGVFTTVNGILLFLEPAEAVYQFGQFYTSVGSYIMFRFLVRDEEDVKRAIRALAYVTIVVAGFMSYEVYSGRNLVYSLLGGEHANLLQMAGERDDKVRAAGVFAHPILAGTFGGFMMPLFVGLWAREKKGRLFSAGGAIGAIIMALTANSSTALMGLLGGVCGFCFWPMRTRMRTVRWGIIAGMICLQLYMTSPIWHIISDIDLAGGSSSWHRYMLVDQCIRHFTSWVFVGTKDYGNWGLDSFDLSDQYVGTADTAGLIPLILFLAGIVIGFKYLGRMRRAVENKDDKKQEIFIWAFGASLFANVVAFFGIGYFDQTIVAWYALLAMIAAVTLPSRTAEAAEALALGAKPGFGFSPALSPSPVASRRSVENPKHTPHPKTAFSRAEQPLIQKP